MIYTGKLENAIKESIKKDVIEAYKDINLDDILSPKEIKYFITRLAEDIIIRNLQGRIKTKIDITLKKFDEKLDQYVEDIVRIKVYEHILEKK